VKLTVDTAKDSFTDTSRTVYHHLSLNLLSRLHSGDELIAHNLISNVIFNVDFLRQVFLKLRSYLSFSAGLSLSCLNERYISWACSKWV